MDKEKVIIKNINGEEIKNKDTIDLTKEQVDYIKSKDCNCKRRRDGKLVFVSWLLLLILAILIAALLTIVIIDIFR